MSAPPEKKKKESTTISMVIKELKPFKDEQVSAAKIIYGFPWRLRLENRWHRKLKLHCEMSDEAELWCCTARLKPIPECKIFPEKHEFKSWDKASQTAEFYSEHFKSGSVLEVKIESNDNGENWKRRPILDQLEFRDGILVIGKEKKKINVHKASLASQSSFFHRLFFGGLMEKNMPENTIEAVEYEEFRNLLRIIYRRAGISLTDENVCKVLQLADRFDLKIVEDVCVNYLLSKSTSLSIHQRLLISEKNNLPFLKDRLISRYTRLSLKALMDSPDWEVLSKETAKALLKRSCDLLDSRNVDADNSEPEHDKSST